MCTTIVIGIQLSDLSQAQAVEGRCGELAHEKALAVKREGVQKEQIRLIEEVSAIVPHIALAVVKHPTDNCSCEIIEGIQSDAITPEHPPIGLFDLVRAIQVESVRLGISRLVIAFVEDQPVALDFKKRSIAAFEKEVLHHYGWLTKEEQLSWQYDMNVLVEVCDV